jgi:hypothetical protein
MARRVVPAGARDSHRGDRASSPIGRFTRVALERRDVDKGGRAVMVQRRFADGVLTAFPKTERSRRRVPLTARALDAYDRLPAQLQTRLVFPAPRGGAPASGSTPSTPPVSSAAALPPAPHVRDRGARRRRVDLRARPRDGASVKEIDCTCGHLARGAEDSIRVRLEARADRFGVEVASAGDGE